MGVFSIKLEIFLNIGSTLAIPLGCWPDNIFKKSASDNQSR